MTRQRIALLLVVSLGLLQVACFAQDTPPANVQVTVDGAAAEFTGPILMVDMQYPLLPADTFLRALGATSTWNANAQRLDIAFGRSAVQMWSDRDWITVDGERGTLEVGLKTFGGVPYVSGPEMAALLGFDVQWDQLSLALAIGTPSVMPEGPTIAATLLEVRPGPPATLLVRVNETGEVGEVTLAENPVIQRGRAGEDVMSAQLADLLPGDLTEIVFDEANTAIGVRASYAESFGIIAAISGNRMTMQDGASYPLGGGVAAFGSDGAPLHLLSAVGQAALITQNPQDNSVWRILAQRRGTPTPPAMAQPTIAAFTLPQYAMPLGEGDALAMRLIGTAGATATVELGATGQAVDLPETAPGVYSGSFTVPEGLVMLEQSLVARLRAGDATSEQVQSDHVVTMDGQPPVVGDLLPNHRSRQANPNTNVRANFNDGDGVGVDETTATIVFNGADVTEGAVIRPGGVVYDPPEALAPGEYSATVQVADRVGNVGRAEWIFSVPTVQVGILNLTHDATEALRTGATINVTMQVAAPGQAASFSIADVTENVAMTRVGETNSYQGSYVVERDDVATDAVLSASFTAADGTLYEADAEQTITITPPVVPFAITAPQADVTAPRRVTPAGTAPPGSIVRWTLSYQEFILAGAVATDTVRADAAGVWEAQDEVDLRLMLIGMADRYTLTAELLNEAGVVQATETVEFKARD